jgi:hypothetical protein
MHICIRGDALEAGAMFSESTALGSVSRREAEDPSGRKPVKCSLCGGVLEQLGFANWNIAHMHGASLQTRQAVAIALYVLAIPSIGFAAEMPANIFVDSRNNRAKQEKKGRWWLSRRSSACVA